MRYVSIEETPLLSVRLYTPDYLRTLGERPSWTNLLFIQREFVCLILTAAVSGGLEGHV